MYNLIKKNDNAYITWQVQEIDYTLTLCDLVTLYVDTHKKTHIPHFYMWVMVSQSIVDSIRCRMIYVLSWITTFGPWVGIKHRKLPRIHCLHIIIFGESVRETKACHLDNFVVIVGTISFCNNLWWQQWWLSHQIDYLLFSVVDYRIVVAGGINLTALQILSLGLIS